MHHIKLKPNQKLFFKENGDATPTQSLHEAIELVKSNKLSEAELDYHGFTFLITPDSDIKEKLADYHYWRDNKTVMAKIGNVEFRMPIDVAKKVIRLQKIIKA